MEEWKEIKGFDGNYLINKNGDIISKQRIVEFINKNGITKTITINEKKMKNTLDKKTNILRVNLIFNGKAKNHSVHKLVYQTFISEIKSKIFIKHKDNNPLNCNVDNLYLTNCVHNRQQKEKTTKIKKEKTIKKKEVKVYTLSSVVNKQANLQYNNNKHYIDNDLLQREIIICKGQGKISDKMQKYLYKITYGIFIKLNVNYSDEYKYDLFNDVYLDLLTKYHKFNHIKYENALAYLTEITKRSFAMHYTFEKNKSRKQYNDFNNKIKVINIGYLYNNY